MLSNEIEDLKYQYNSEYKYDNNSFDFDSEDTTRAL